MTKISSVSLYGSNINPRMVDASAKVLKKFDIPITYVKADMVHGEFINQVCNSLDADIYFFIDVDCVPTCRSIYDETLNYVIKHNTFIGNAHLANHIPPARHVYAGVTFYMITKDCYNKMGRPSFAPTHRSDTSEEISYVAEEMGIKYKAYYPTKFDAIPIYGVPWRMGNYGHYGMGTLYANKIYHLFESRTNLFTDMYLKRCDEILHDRFDTSRMYDCLNFS